MSRLQIHEEPRSAFTIDGRPDLTLVVYNPTTSKDLNKVRKLLKTSSEVGA